ncbi:MAG: hydroxyacid dehydrogenase [Pseudomonadota bacterium]
MSKKRVLVAETLEQAGIDLLRQHFDVDVRERTDEQTLAGLIGDYDALMIKTYTRVSKAVIDRAGKLRIVARAGSGLDKVDLAYAKEKGLTVRNTPQANVVSVAELVFGLMLAVSRKLAAADRYVRAGEGWDRDRFTGVELAGKTLGIVGFGNIGKLVARRALAFDMQLVGYDPFVDAAGMAEHGVRKVETVDEVIDAADYITVHVPLLDATRGLFSTAQFARMKPTAIFINTARGEVVDEPALIAALQTGEIAGAGLDVYEAEPPNHPELLALDNVVLCPHIGAATREALNRMTVQAAEMIIDALRD